MKLLFDLFPVIVFFATYKFFGHDGKGNPCGVAAQGAAPLPLAEEPILLATVAAIVATILQVGWLLARRKRVDPMLWVSLAIIVVFGGATLYFRNPAFIQWKPSILYWLFSASLSFSALVLGKNLIRKGLEASMSLPEPVWARLNWAWAGFFFFMGFANLAAVYNLSCDGWVNFKLFGGMGLMLVFVLLQSVYLSRHLPEPETEQE